MKGKVAEFFLVLVLYSLIFLVRNDWNLTTRQMAEMIFLGTLLGIFSVVMTKPLTRLVENTVKRIFSLKEQKVTPRKREG